MGTIAVNGMLLEQSQVLTTHNLAVLVDGLNLTGELRERALELAWRTFGWIVHRLAQRVDHVQLSHAERLRDEVHGTVLAPAVEGLRHVLGGGRFTETGTMRRGHGRRFLGWTEGTHSFLVSASRG